MPKPDTPQKRKYADYVEGREEPKNPMSKTQSPVKRMKLAPDETSVLNDLEKMTINKQPEESKDEAQDKMWLDISEYVAHKVLKALAAKDGPVQLTVDKALVGVSQPVKDNQDPVRN